MTETPKQTKARTAQIRTAATVMAGTMILWMAAQFFGGQLGLPIKYAFLFDLAAIVGLVWALFVTYLVWRARKNDAAGDKAT
jgi:fatty acid desaturase